MGIRRNRRILSQYIVSLVALIIAPFLVLDIIFFVNGLHQVEAAYVASQEYAMRQAIQNMDDDFSAYRTVVNQIAMDSDITPYLLRSGGYDSVLAMRKLTSYQAQINCFDMLYLHIRGDDKLYSGNGLTSIRNFMKSGYSFSEEDGGEAFQRYISEGGTFALSLDGNGGILARPHEGKRYVAVTYPWINSVVRPLGTAVGLVDVDYFADRLGIAEAGYRQGIYLLDARGRLQFQVENQWGLPAEAVEEMAARYAGAGTYREKAGGACFLVIGESQVTGWRYMAVIPRGQFLLKYIYSQNAVVGGVSLLLFFCILLGIAQAFRMYRPIRELWDILGRIGPEPDFARQRAELGEWEHLRTSVTGIVEKNRSIARELEESRTAYRQSLLKALLLGAVSGENSREALLIQDTEFEEEGFCVMILYSSASYPHREMVEGIIGESGIPGIHGLSMENGGYLTLIWNIASWTQEREGTLERLYQELSEGTEEEWILAVGGYCQELGGVSRSYLEALTVGESFQARNRPGVHYYEAFRRMGESNEMYQSILAYVEEHYDDSGISLSEVADRFGLSVSYLSKFFRKCSGRNFLEYVTDRRIEKACRLLRDTDLKVKEIVEQVGYLDVASFTKKFRNILGVSPVKYREQARREKRG